MARPKKSKIKTARSRDEVRAMVPRRVDERGKQEQRSMRLNSLFDEFRRDVEGIMNPWSSSLEWRLPREFSMIRPELMKEEGVISRTPLVDMIDKGDRYSQVLRRIKYIWLLQMIRSKYLLNNQKKKLMKINRTTIFTTNALIDLFIVAFQYQKKYYLQRLQPKCKMVFFK